MPRSGSGRCCGSCCRGSRDGRRGSSRSTAIASPANSPSRFIPRYSKGCWRSPKAGRERMGAGRRLVLMLAPALLAACHSTGTPGPAAAVGAAPSPSPAPEPAPATIGWREAIEPADADRLRRIDAAWREALAMARGAGFGRAIAAEGPLLDPAAGLARADPPPGPYRCRVVRLGAGEGAAALRAYPSYFCHISVDGNELAFTKQGGSELPAGYIWKDGDRRGVFLGAM